MKSYDYEAVVYDNEVYCVECLPEGIDCNSEDVTPIFAGDEWDSAPSCSVCGTLHDYMSIIKEDDDPSYCEYCDNEICEGKGCKRGEYLFCSKDCADNYDAQW